jgi:hypothetical protein
MIMSANLALYRAGVFMPMMLVMPAMLTLIIMHMMALLLIN